MTSTQRPAPYTAALLHWALEGVGVPADLTARAVGTLEGAFTAGDLYRMEFLVSHRVRTYGHDGMTTLAALEVENGALRAGLDAADADARRLRSMNGSLADEVARLQDTLARVQAGLASIAASVAPASEAPTERVILGQCGSCGADYSQPPRVEQCPNAHRVPRSARIRDW